MADADKTLKLLLEMGVVGREDVKAANDLLSETKDTTKDFTKETDKSAEATQGFNVQGRAQFLLFSEINRILPGLGTAMHAAFAGPLAPIILIGVGIAAAKSALSEYNAELDKWGEDAAAGHAEAIAAVRDAWDSVEEGMAKYFVDLQTAAQDKDPTSTLIKNLKALQEEQFKAEIEQMKLIGRPQAEIDARKDEHDKKTVALLEQERSLRVAELANAQFAIEKDRERAALADARVKTHADELKKLQDENAPGGKPTGELEAAQKRLKQLQDQWLFSPAAQAIGITSGAEMEQHQKEIAAAQEDVNRIEAQRRARQKQLEDEAQAEKTAKAEADKKLADDQARAVAAQSRITELSGPQGEIVQTGLREHVQEAGRRASETIEDAKAMIKNHTDLFGSLAATFKYYNEHAGSMNAEVEAIRREIQRINSVLAVHAQQTMNQ